MTLDEIRNLLTFRDRPELDCGEVNELVDAHIVQVRSKIRELKALEQQLIELRHSCDTVRSAKECGILHGLAQAL